MRSIVLLYPLGAVSALLAIFCPLQTAIPTDPLVTSPDPTLWSREELRDHAKVTFRELTREQEPTWEKREMGWQDQCDVGLMDGDCTAPTPVLGPESKSPSQGLQEQLGAGRALTPAANDRMHFIHTLALPIQSGRIHSKYPPGSSDSLSKTVSIPPVLQTIYFNHSAVETINGSKMNKPATIEARLARLQQLAAPLSDMRIRDFEPDAMVVKSFWEVIVPGGQTLFAKNYATGAHLFRRDIVRDPSSGVLKGLFRLQPPQTEPYVDLDEAKRCFYRRETDSNGSGHDVYSLGCFHFRKVHPNELQQVSQNATARADIKGPQCKGGDADFCYLIMVGVHVMTREAPNWLWMTYWWSSDWWQSHPAGAEVENMWDLFEVNATGNNTDPVANPYLEGPTSGMYSNCMECHRHAVYRRGTANNLPSAEPNVGSRYFTGIAGSEVNKPLSFSNTNPLPRDKIPDEFLDLQFRPCYFRAALQTHFLWTIALHNATRAPVDPCANHESRSDRTTATPAPPTAR